MGTEGDCNLAGCFWDATNSECVGCDTSLICDDGSTCNGLTQGECDSAPQCEWDFAAALIDPPPLAPAMARALKRHRRMFGDAKG